MVGAPRTRFEIDPTGLRSNLGRGGICPAAMLVPSRLRTILALGESVPFFRLDGGPTPSALQPVVAAAGKHLSTPPAPGRTVLGQHLRRYAAVVVALAAFVTFANSIGNYFMMDDYWLVEWSASHPWSAVLEPYRVGGQEEYKRYWFNASRINAHAGEGYFRPLVSVVYKGVWSIWGLDARAYHLSSIALHVATSLIVLWLAGQFFRRRGPAFIVGLAFAVHPAKAEAIQWVGGNANPLVAVFYLLAVTLFMRSRDADSPPWFFVASVGSFVLALLGHELAVTLPVLLGVVDWWKTGFGPAAGGGPGSWRWRSIGKRLTPFVAIGGAYVVFHAGIFADIQQYQANSMYLHQFTDPPLFARSVLFQFAYLLSHLFLPLPFVPIDLDNLEPLLGKVPLMALSAALLVVLGWLWRRMGGRDSRMLVAAAFFLIPVLPAFLVTPTERQLYVPSVGFCLLLGLAYERLTAQGQSLRVRVAFLSLLGIVLAWTYNVMWSFPANIARGQIQELQRQLPAPEKGMSVYLLNLWSPSFGLEMMPALLAGDPTLDVQVLSIHPKLLPVGEFQIDNAFIQRFFAAALPGATGKAPVTAEWESADVLSVRIRNGRFMRSLIEEIHPAAESVQVTGARVEYPNFSVEVLQADADGVEAMRFVFKPGVTRVVFDLQDGRVRRLSPD